MRSRHDYLPFGEEIDHAVGLRSQVPGYGAFDATRHRFTGKERDAKAGLDYFGARYFSGAQGRFTGADPDNAGAILLEPQSWNGYAYAINNPLRYVDPDGLAIETPWDVANLALDVASFAANVAAGNYGSAAVDAVGLAYDAFATATPFLPAGAGTLIKTARAADRIADSAKTADRVADLAKAADKVADAARASENALDAAKATERVADVAKVAKGGETAATKTGRQAHRDFAEKVSGKKGWSSEPTIKGPDGKVLRPDAVSPRGRPLELKPNTPSGHRRGQAQLRKYEAATGKKGRVVYYDP